MIIKSEEKKRLQNTSLERLCLVQTAVVLQRYTLELLYEK